MLRSVRLRLNLAGRLVLPSIGVAPTQAQDQPALDLHLLGRYETGIFDEGAAEIAAYNPATRRLFFVNADANSVVVLDISDPANPTEVTTIAIDDLGGSAQGDANSVAVAHGIVAVAVAAEATGARGSVYFFDPDGGLLREVEAGFLPDAVTFSPDGTMVAVSNEGEPSDDYTVDPEGSITLIDLTGGVGGAVAHEVTFADFNLWGSDSPKLAS